MSHNRRMLTLQQLRKRLLTCDVDAVSRASGVSAKTIYRIRTEATRMTPHGEKRITPNYATLVKLEEAMRRTARKAEKELA